MRFQNTNLVSVSYKSPFVSPIDSRDEADGAKRKFDEEHSDHLALLRAYGTWRRSRAQGKHQHPSTQRSSVLGSWVGERRLFHIF